MFSSIGLFHGSLGLLSLAATSISLVVLYRGISVGKSPLGVCLTNLAVNQLGFAVFGHLTFVVPSHFAQHWVWGPSACDFFGFVKSYFQIVIFSCVLILCVERYMRDWKKNAFYTASFFFKLSVSSWLYEALWALFPFFGWGRYEKKEFSCDIMMIPSSSEWKDFSYAISFAFATFIVPSGIMLHLIGRSRKSDKVFKAQQRLWFDSPRIRTTTTLLAGSIFFLFSLITLLGFLDWLPAFLGEQRKFHFETAHSMLSHGFLFYLIMALFLRAEYFASSKPLLLFFNSIGIFQLLVFINPIWYLIGVPSIRKELGRYHIENAVGGGRRRSSLRSSRANSGTVRTSKGSLRDGSSSRTSPTQMHVKFSK